VLFIHKKIFSSFQPKAHCKKQSKVGHILPVRTVTLARRSKSVKVAVFSTRNYDREYLSAANGSRHELHFFEPHLDEQTAGLAAGFSAVCVFVNDSVTGKVISKLRLLGVGLIALRCAGYNNVDITAAETHGLVVLRVPGYSPYAVAEHAIALMLALNRNLHRAYNRVREGNFALDGLLGFDLHGKTVGIIGTGKIGTVVADILRGFGCPTLAFDPIPNERCRSSGVRYMNLDELLANSDVITLHCPLTPQNKHIIDAAALRKMKSGVMLINTSRGALIDTMAVIEALKGAKIGYLGLDVYEEEEQIFFEDRSGLIISDDVFSRLLTFPNVIITGHQAFFTREALQKIAATTVANITDFEHGGALENRVVQDW
jgi:D-lactate dehydrogenase